MTSRPTISPAAIRLHQTLDRHRRSIHVEGTRDELAVAGESPDASEVSQTDRVAVKPDDEPELTGTCWCISKGMAGMNSQTSGLAKAVGLPFEFRHSRMRFPWNCLPLSLVPRSGDALRDRRVLRSDEPPRLVISCGRHGIIPSLTLKKMYGDRVFTVHIQDPKIRTNGFDLVVIPKHDETRAENVYLTMGALHYVTPEVLREAAESPEAVPLGDGDRPIVGVLLGGPNGYYSFSQSDTERLIDKLHRLTIEHDVRLAILKSRRTPGDVAKKIEAAFGRSHFVWDGEGTNPYFAALATASWLVVTGDSVSMVTEAAATGLPVFVHHLTEQRPAPRFRRFHEMFEAAGITRPFAGELAEWDYEPPNDTPKVARLIRERMLEQ